MAINFIRANTQYVDCGVSPGSAADLSLSWWMTAKSLNQQIPLDKHPITGTAGWTVKARLDGDIYFRVGSDTDWSQINVGAGSYSVGVPIHVVCTFAAGVAKMYLDGVLAASTTGITQTVDDAATAFRVGGPSVASLSEKLDGTMEDVRVYDTVLMANEVKEIYVAQGLDMNMRILPHLQLRLPMRGQRGFVTGTVKDFSKNRNHGTSTNGPAYVPGLIRLARVS